jgi:hypothetical protein
LLVKAPRKRGRESFFGALESFYTRSTEWPPSPRRKPNQNSEIRLESFELADGCFATEQ